MQIVIDIPEGIYKTLCKNPTVDIVRQAVINGTPLPKGHGRLIDENQIAGDGSWDIADRLDATPTIIEADKGEE